MEQNRNDSNNNKNKPEGEKPKTGIWTALIIALVLVLVFSWIYSAVESSQYEQTTYSDFRAAMDAGQLAEVEIRSDRRKRPRILPFRRPASRDFPLAMR